MVALRMCGGTDATFLFVILVDHWKVINAARIQNLTHLSFCLFLYNYPKLMYTYDTKFE